MNDKLTIVSLNNQKYHIKHKNDNVVFAVDYNDKYVVGQPIEFETIYNSITGLQLKKVTGICVASKEKGIKKVAFTFRRRQNYSRKVGSSRLFCYIQANLGSK